MGMTVVRMIVDLIAVPSTLSTAIGIMNISVAIMVADQEQFAASVFPDPNTVNDRPVGGWMWRHRMFVQDHTTGGAVTEIAKVHVDLRSKRKIGHGELVLLGDATLSSGSAFSVDVFGWIRTLVLLP